MNCSEDYSLQTKNALAQLSEKEMSFELIEVIEQRVILNV